MIQNKKTKIQAYRELWKIAQKGFFDTYVTVADGPKGERVAPVH